MKEELRERVFSYIKKNQMTEQMGAAVIGVSGGADSVCLLLLLMELRERLGLELLAVHVEHGIRGESSLADAEFVRRLCDRLQIPCVVHSENILRLAAERHTSVEETARNVRYAVFAEEADRLVKRSGKKCCIAVAHNANDNAETMLHHLARGTGLHGLAGIPPVRGNIIRPLLFLRREEIEEYLRIREQDFCLDITNWDSVYRRNKIRHEILPRLEEINPAAIDHMGRTAELLREIEGYLNQAAEKVLKSAQTEQGLLREVLRPLPEVLKKEVLRMWLNRVMGGQKDVAACHINALVKLLDAPVGKETFLPGGCRAAAEYRCLTIKKENAPEVAAESAPESFSVKELEQGGETVVRVPVFGRRKKVLFRLLFAEKTMKIPRKSYTKWFDYDKIKDNLVLRKRREGDFLVIDDQGNRKLLRRYLMDEKIPRTQRDCMLLLCSGSHVLWVIGYRISEAFKVSETTEKILEVQFMEEEEDE